MSLSLARAAPRAARNELLVTWAACIGLLAAAKVLSLVEPTGILRGNIAGVAAFLFIALPERRIHGRGEHWAMFGLPWSGLTPRERARQWLRGAAYAAA